MLRKEGGGGVQEGNRVTYMKTMMYGTIFLLAILVRALTCHSDVGCRGKCLWCIAECHKAVVPPSLVQ